MKHTSKINLVYRQVKVEYDGEAIGFLQQFPYPPTDKYKVSVSLFRQERITQSFFGNVEQIQSGKGYGETYDRHTGETWSLCPDKGKEIADLLLFVDANIFASNRPSGEEYTSLLEEACKRFTGLIRADEEE